MHGSCLQIIMNWYGIVTGRCKYILSIKVSQSQNALTLVYIISFHGVGFSIPSLGAIGFYGGNQA